VLMASVDVCEVWWRQSSRSAAAVLRYTIAPSSVKGEIGWNIKGCVLKKRRNNNGFHSKKKRRRWKRWGLFILLIKKSKKHIGVLFCVCVSCNKMNNTCLWYDVLCADVRNYIRSFLDPVSCYQLRRTSFFNRNEDNAGKLPRRKKGKYFHGVPKSLRAIATAAQYRHLGYFKEEFIRLGGRRFFDRERNEQMLLSLFQVIARSNGSEVLEWLVENEQHYCPAEYLISCASRMAAQTGNIAWFHFVVKHGYNVDSDRLRPSILSQTNNATLIAFLKNAGYSYRSCKEAAEHADLESLREMHDRGAVLTFECATAAIENNRLDILMYVQEHGSPIRHWSLHYVAWRKATGFTPIIDYLDSHGCEKSCVGCERAAELGNLKLLKTLREERSYPWDDGATYAATVNGHLQCLKYLIEHGCAWKRSTLHTDSADSDDEEGTHNNRPCIEYLRSLGDPPESEDEEDSFSV
jgi:hypothetical protein